MQKQMDLWGTPQETCRTQNLWKTFTSHQQQEVITILADLIKKSIGTETLDQNQEESHER